MKLQQIKLAGFKSFVDATTIEVHGQLVGIVGPNGCGKSNVIDAVRWVLGESSAKQLRGESMADIIFNGSLKRKAVSRATVELIFDNTAKSLYGLWNNYNEIAIKRLISRQGESNYYINNQQVRRKDIAELFLGTGVGTKGYAVIEQGMISRIIESKPEDMRLFIEEAAGVSKYRERRRETLQRLAQSEENLLRLSDIHSQVIKQLTTLDAQAEVACLHQRLTAELKQLQRLQLAIKISDASRILNEANQFILHCEEDLRVLGYQLEEVSASLLLEQEQKSSQEQLLQEMLVQFNDYRTSLARVEERYKHYSELLKRFESESLELASREGELQQDIAELAVQEDVIQEKIKDNQLLLSDQTLVREEQQLLLEDKQQAFDEIAKQVTSRQSKLNVLKHDLDLLQNSLKHKLQQKANLLTRQQRLAQEGQAFNFEGNYQFIAAEIELVAAEFSTLEEQILLGGAEEAQVQAELSQLQEELGRQNKLLAASNATIVTLRQLLQPTPATLVADENSNSLLLSDPANRELWQYLQVTPGYELALEVALANVLQAKVLAGFNPLLPAPDFALSVWLQAGEPVGAPAGAPAKPQSGSLSQWVAISDPVLTGLYRYLNRYQLIANVADGLNLPADQYGVTLNGHLATQDYISYHVNQNGRNLLQHQQQLEQEEANALQLDANLRLLETRHAAAKEHLQRLQNDLAGLANLLKRLGQKRHDLELEFSKQEQIHLQNQRQHERLASEGKLIAEEISYLDNEVEELEIQLEDKVLSNETLQLASQDLELERLDAETSLQLAKNKLYDLDMRTNQMIIDNQLLQQQKLNALNLVAEKRLQLSVTKQKLADLKAERISFNNANQAQEIIELQANVGSLTGQMHALQQQMDTLANKVINLKNKAGALNSSYQRNLEKINQTKFKQQEQQILLATYQESLTAFNLTAEQLLALLTDDVLPLAELSRCSKLLEEQISALGLINLKAIEDLEAARTNERELLAQLGDLGDASQMLQDAISQIDGETRKLLQQTFDKLNQAIVVYFKTLFGGGDAHLALTDKDILIGGVQIFAEPPGKKNSTIHLLSGGEKALTAMSFIFALFSLNPAPFCLLDEVDAPLDDANSGRFCKLVQELAAKTQFIYISHNRLAMEMADQLVGVTMQEKGVSTTVSVSLIEAVQQIAESAEVS